MCYARIFALDGLWLSVLQMHLHATGRGERKSLANVFFLKGWIVLDRLEEVSQIGTEQRKSMTRGL